MSRIILKGIDRLEALSAFSACACCGFLEADLIASTDSQNKVLLHCEECLEHLQPSKGTRYLAAWMPELTQAAVSHYSRLVAWLSLAAKFHGGTGALMPDDCLPIIPKAFTMEKLISQKSAQASAKHSDTLKAAFNFFINRAAYTTDRIGTNDPQTAMSKLSKFEFSSAYRVFPVQISMKRIRKWQDEQSSFWSFKEPASDFIANNNPADLFDLITGNDDA